MPPKCASAREAANAAVLARWNAPGAAGFFAWMADVKPRILTRGSRYEVATLEPWQESFIRDALEPGQDKPFKHSILLHVTPRRHAKSTTYALLVLWLFTSRENQNIQLIGNAGDHSERVQMRPLRGMIRNTPALKKMIPESDLQRVQINNPHMGNVIQSSNTSMTMAFGDKLGVLWISDFHACPDTGPYDAMQASLLDTEGSLCLIDSNTDSEGGHVHQLELLSETDPGIFCRRIEYRDLDHYMAEAPSWVDRDKVRRLQATQLPHAFNRDILGKRSAAKNALFPPEVITLCRCELPHPFPADRIPELVANRRYCVGAGLDRAKKLFGGDASVWTTTLKTTSEGGEPEYVVLRQHVFELNTAAAIKKAIAADHKAYKLDAVTLEAYEVADLEPWLVDQKIPVEVVSAHAKNQNLSFVELHNVAKEGRLRFSTSLEQLATEMRTFIYEEARDGKYSFGHSSQKFHDDTVYSLNWSVFATRARVLQVYALARLVCASKSKHRPLCFLMGGQMELPCKHECRAWHEVSEMHRAYCRLRDDPLSLPEFFSSYVKVTGPRVYQAA